MILKDAIQAIKGARIEIIAEIALFGGSVANRT